MEEHNVRVSIKKVFFLLSAACIFFSVLLPTVSEARSSHNVIILNSYNRGFAWTDEQTEGILHVVRNQKPEAAVYIEYLDWKNSPYSDNLVHIAELFRIKYLNKRVDLVITTDDVALEFAVKHRPELFSNAPVVFSGVQHKAAERILAGQGNVTGIYEEIGALAQHPSAKHTPADSAVSNLKGVGSKDRHLAAFTVYPHKTLHFQRSIVYITAVGGYKSRAVFGGRFQMIHNCIIA